MRSTRLTRYPVPSRSLMAAALALALLGVAGCVPAPTPPGPVVAATAPTADASGVAPQPTSASLTALAALPVKGRAAKTGYSRDAFGQAWADVDHNGCDTRNDVLARDLQGTVFKAGTRDCVVLSGVLADPYTATTIDFRRGADTSTAVQIDHVVALSDAWQKGAQQLSVERRTALANDPLNLLAVDGPTNSSKSDSDAASWLPPSRDFRCAYVARQISVKASYGLWVTAAERDAMAGILAACPDAPAATAPEAPADPASALPATVAPPVPGAPEPVYANCAAVRAAGAAPLLRGHPGYAAHFDGDGDGVACE